MTSLYSKNSNRSSSIENFSLLHRYYPETSLGILAKKRRHNWNIFTTLKGQLNAKNSRYTLHNSHNISEEIRALWKAIPMKGVTTLYVYGIGLGHYYEAARYWLQEDHKRNLIFLENDPVILQLFLQCSHAKEILLDPQVHIHFFDRISPDSFPFFHLRDQFALHNIQITALPNYQKYKAATYTRLKDRIFTDNNLINIQIKELAFVSQQITANILSNTHSLTHSLQGTDFFGQFQNIPAIICGAGPSLSREIPLIKQYKNHALLIAGGTALRALSASGIDPHFASGIDPFPPHYTTIHNTQSLHMPMFYRFRMLPEALNLIEGPKLFIPGGVGYPLTKHIEKELNLKGPILSEGYNIVNFSMEIAKHLGCNPIILVGCDLSYDKNPYCCPVPVDNHPRSLEQEESIIGENKPIAALSNSNTPVITLAKWVREANWIAQYAKKNSSLEIINTSLSGIRLDNTSLQSLDALFSNRLQSAYPFDEWIRSCIHSAKKIPLPDNYLYSLKNKIVLDLNKTKNLLQELSNSLSPNSSSIHLKPCYTSQSYETEKKLSETFTYQTVLPYAIWAINILHNQEKLRFNKKNPSQEELLQLEKNRLEAITHVIDRYLTSISTMSLL